MRSLTDMTRFVLDSKWPVGTKVWYSPSTGIAYAGEIGAPCSLCGDSFSFWLKNMSSQYREMRGKDYVQAALVDCLEKRDR